MTQQINLSQLEPGQRAVIVSVKGKGAARRRMIDMGMTKGSHIQVIRKAPMGDPIDFKLKGYHLSLRKSDAEFIIIEMEE